MRSRLIMPRGLRSRNCCGYFVFVTSRQARDEGAAQTKRIIDAIRGLRALKGWSAQQLAEEMTKAGVPWNADVVVNLEHGRRKSLRVHELLALMFVLDAKSPLDVLVPGDEHYPVTPGLLVDPKDVRAWLRGDTGPLRGIVAKGSASSDMLESVAHLFEQQGNPGAAADMRRLAALLEVPESDADGQD
jgi:transcriptional regulator with XRE-family HTH domain